MTVDATVVKVRQRASHRKSRGGCITCKQRHRKCDETLPVCKRCQASGKTCVRSTDEEQLQAKSRAFRGFRIIQYQSPHDMPRTETILPEFTSLEYFNINTLPFLRNCQPSILWTNVIEQLIQSNDCFRIIASAIGRQQRLTTERKLLDDLPNSAEQEANAYYLSAVRSLRDCVTTSSFSDNALLAPLACFLMVILESLRESPTGVLAHLRCGIQLANRGATQTHSPEFTDILRMIRQVGVSAMLFPPGQNWQHAEIGYLMWGSYMERECSAEAEPSVNDLGWLSGELTEIISDLLLAYEVRETAPVSSASAVEFYATVSTLWPRLTRVENMLEELKVNIPDDKAIYYELLDCRRTILHAHLEIAWVDAAPNSPFHELKTEFVLRRLQSCITLLESFGYGSSFPFSIGTGLMPTLHLIANSVNNTSLRDRITRLIARCPAREVLWNVNEQLDLVSRPLGAAT